ncbi:MAG: ATP-binding cassette domain-containing protein [Muribaculaceae bacterium]|nr:ATP-binding cassette domain-containing protein [Muribaculaceae bacterium]
MQRITLENLLPRVFAGAEIPHGQVWLAHELVFERGCRVIVAADSGRGKSSMVSYICGERSDYSGRISFDGRDIRSLGVKEWCDVRRRHIAVLPQEMRLFPELSALDNVLVKNRLTGRYSTAEIRDMLARLGLADRTDTPAGKLSIGQQQRVAIVRTICQPFDFIILDEPVSHLDEENNRLAAAMIEQAAEQQGAGIITTSVGNPLAIDALTTLTL